MPYYEKDIKPHYGRRLSTSSFTETKAKKLSPGDNVVLVNANSISSEVGEFVSVRIVSDDVAKVLVKTKSCRLKPDSMTDNKNPSTLLWCGATLDEERYRDPNYPNFELRRQKTFKAEKQTIFSNTLKRVEWRGK
jgi:hypothetical protein